MEIGTGLKNTYEAIEIQNEETLAEPALPGRARPVALRSLILLSCGHFLIDLYSNALGALQPLLIARHAMSLTRAGFLGGLLSLSSSVTQPLYGYLSDRFGFRGFTVLAPLMAGVFISCLGLASGFPLLALFVILGGVGIAAFHPQAAEQAASTWRERRGLAMSIFITSGTLGLSLGPTYFSALASWLSLERIYWAALPGIVITCVLALYLPLPAERRPRERRRFDFAAFQPVRRQMLLLYLLVVIRSTIQVVFAQFLPLYFHLERGYSISQASYMLTLFLFGGGVGGFLGGTLADRFGGKRIVMFSMCCSVPFLILFLITTGWMSASGLFFGGLILLFTTPVNVTMAQELVPSQVSTVSALMMGFAWGMAGLVGIPFVGWVADRVGLEAALGGVVLLPVAGFFLALGLPDSVNVRKLAS